MEICGRPRGRSCPRGRERLGAATAGLNNIPHAIEGSTAPGFCRPPSNPSAPWQGIGMPPVRGEEISAAFPGCRSPRKRAWGRRRSSTGTHSPRALFLGRHPARIALIPAVQPGPQLWSGRLRNLSPWRRRDRATTSRQTRMRTPVEDADAVDPMDGDL